MKKRLSAILALITLCTFIPCACTASGGGDETVPITSETVPSDTLPDTTLPDTTVPDTTVPDTTEEERTEETTTAPPETEPPVTEPPEPERKTVSVLAVGDNLIHGYLITAGGRFGYDRFYHRIKDTVSEADLAIINQESCFTYNENIYSGYPLFATPIGVGEAAIAAGFDVFTLATNHAWDRGKQPILDTLDFFSKHPEVTALGAYATEKDYQGLTIIEKNGIRIALFNYSYGFNCNEEVWWMVDILSDKSWISWQLKQAEELADITIVMPHWGVEYAYTPHSTQTKWAQFFADNGADVIIGHHPHCLQPMMTLTGKNGNKTLCYYSLGNFISNQSTVKTNVGGMASFTIVKDENGTRVEDNELIPTTVQAGMKNKIRTFEAMLLSDLTPELLKQNIKFKENSVQDFWDVYNKAIKSYP